MKFGHIMAAGYSIDEDEQGNLYAVKPYRLYREKDAELDVSDTAADSIVDEVCKYGREERDDESV